VSTYKYKAHTTNDAFNDISSIVSTYKYKAHTTNDAFNDISSIVIYRLDLQLQSNVQTVRYTQGMKCL